MRQRLTFILGAFTALLLAAGAAWAAMPTTVESESVIEVADAGSVTMVETGTGLEIISVEAAAGWDHEVEVAAGREVEVDFRKGTRRIQFDAELEDGQIRVRVRERVQAGDQTSSTLDDTSSTTVDDSTSTTAGDSSPTTVDDSTSSTVDDSSSTTIDDSTSTTVHEDTTSSTVGDTTSTTIDDSTSTTQDDDAGPAGSGSETHSVGGVATVTIAWADGRMSLVSVSVADGWQVEEQEIRSDRIKIEFESGDDSEARFEADFHDGSIRVKSKVD